MISKILDVIENKVIEKIEDINGLVVYEAFKNLIASGVPPLTLLNCKGVNLIDYKIYGNSVQEGENLFDINSITDVYISDTIMRVGQEFTFDVDKTLIISAEVYNSNSYYRIKSNGIYSGTFQILEMKTINLPASDTLVIYSTLKKDLSDIRLTEKVSPTTPIEIESVGEYDETTGKYKIPVKVRGKNLIKPQDIFSVNASGNNYSELVEDGRNTIRYIDASDGRYTGFKFKENTQYTVSAYVKTTIKNSANTGPSTWFNFFYTDGTKSPSAVARDTDWTYKELTSTAGKTVKAIGIASVNYTNWIYVDVDTFQIEEGSATDYEPYVEPITTNIYLNDPLRKAGNYADYIDFENKKVVRKIGKYSFNGTETFGVSGNTTATSLACYTPNIIPAPRINGVNGFINIGNVGQISVMYKYNNGFFYNSNAMHFLKVQKSVIPNYNDGLSDADKIVLLKEYLTNLYLAETPVKIVYELDTPIEETIELPNIPTIKGTTILEVDTNIQPSNMEVTYKGKGE